MESIRRPTSELHENIIAVEEALSQIALVRQKLEENVNQVKSEIHSKICSHLEQLHSREIELLRQVDIYSSQQLSLLQTQYAKLYHTLGTLQSALTSSEDHLSIIAEDMKSVEEIKAQRIPFLSWKADLFNLQNTIHTFGVIDLVGGVLQLPLPQISKCLPSRVEEYEDGDHHVLYKTLEELKAQKEQELRLKISFPLFSPKTEDWLLKECKGTNNQLKEQFAPHKAAQLQQWLHEIKTEAELEPCVEEFQMISPISDVVSDSVEMLSHPDTLSSQWLDSNINWLSPIHSVNNMKNECCCENKSIEIENLGSKLCVLKSTNSNMESIWLSQKNAEMSCGVSMSKVCRANEVCKSLEECICDEKCCLLFPTKTPIPMKVDKNIRDILLSPMRKIRESKLDIWLPRKTEEEEKMNTLKNLSLINSAVENKEASFAVTFPNVQRSMEICWLPRGSQEKTDSNKAAEEEEIWLLNELSHKPEIEPKTAVLAMFQDYLQPLNLNRWLLKKTERTQTDLINKMKWLALNRMEQLNN